MRYKRLLVDFFLRFFIVIISMPLFLMIQWNTCQSVNMLKKIVLDMGRVHRVKNEVYAFTSGQFCRRDKIRISGD